MVKVFLKWISLGLIYLMKPLKLFAFRTRFLFLKRLILGVTTFVDFLSSWLYGQNEIMLLHQKIYKGNFIFGHGVMKTDYSSAISEIPRPSLRTNSFMGIPVVSGNEVFVVNSPLISLGEPFRTLVRKHIEETIFTPELAALDYDQVKLKCTEILAEWVSEDNAKDITIMRSTSTRMIILLLQNITISKKDGEDVTAAYLRRFIELSLFKRYFPIVSGLLGSEKSIKKDAFYKLRALGVSNPVIDATLFAAMFSIGTLFIRCVGDIRRNRIDYASLPLEIRRNFVIEAVRLYPTVTTTHRIIENNEEIVIAGQKISLTAGDEMVYPFACINTDESAFKCPHQVNVNRTKEEYDKVLSWSVGPHACPAKDLSVLVTMVMLDALAQKQPLASIDYGDSLI